jgi:hypothetical protein
MVCIAGGIWIMMESLKGLIGDIAEHTNQFLIPQLVEVNFGKNAPRAEIEIEEIGRELTSAMFEIYLGLVQSGKAHPGVKKIEELLNIPSETDDEKIDREAREDKLGVPQKVSSNGMPAPEDKIFSHGRSRNLAERVWSKL